MAAGGHPVGRQHHVAQVLNRRGGNIGERLGHGHASGSRRVQQRHRSALSHGHGFTGVTVIVSDGDRAVRHRHLPAAHHLIAADESGNRSVADGDEKGLIAHAGHAQHPLGGLAHVRAERSRCLRDRRAMGHVAVAARRLAEQHLHRQIDGPTAGVPVGQGEPRRFSRLAHHRERAALASADFPESLQAFRRHRQDETFLGFVAPDLHRRHARIGVGNLAQLEGTAASGAVDQLGKGVGQSAGADVVYRQNRVVFSQMPAAVDDFLAAALHLGVVPLHRGVVELRLALARGQRGSSTAAQPDEHGGSTHDDDARARRQRRFLHQLAADVAQSPGHHDRLVVAAHFAGRCLLLEGAEVTAERRPAELVVEGGRAHRAFGHDVQRRDDAIGTPVTLLPRALVSGNTQIRHRETGQARFASGAAAGGGLVPDFSTGTGGGSGVGRDRGGVVVGFHLHQNFDLRLGADIAAGDRMRMKPASRVAANDGGIVLVCRQHPSGILLVGVADHVEQRVWLIFPVDGPARVEDLVPAVLGVRLSEHHQLDVVGIPRERLKAQQQVVDLVVAQGEPHFAVGALERRPAVFQHRNGGKRAGFLVPKKQLRFFQPGEQSLGHAVMHQRRDPLYPACVGLEPISRGEQPSGCALHAQNALEPAVVQDVGGLAGPGRHGSRAGRHQQTEPGRAIRGFRLRVDVQYALQIAPLAVVQRVAAVKDVNESSAQVGDLERAAVELGEQLVASKCRKRGAARQYEHGGRVECAGHLEGRHLTSL